MENNYGKILAEKLNNFSEKSSYIYESVEKSL
ncbi:hypothetical protein FUSO6_08215 [Fusobacterium necrophorum DAB]|nr:hypothetical protein FUSO6_08215 [Fusobacterium necrophorum DAB]